MSNFVTQDDLDLVENGAVRVPVVLCLDISGSMRKNDAIESLNKGIEAFYDSIKNNEQAKASCEIAIITFADEANLVEDFSLIDRKELKRIDYVPNGGTALAHGVMKSLEVLDERKQKYKDTGTDYCQPWLVIITDRLPGDVEDLPAAHEEVKKRIVDKKLTLFPAVVGGDGDPEKIRSILDELDKFSPVPGRALHIKDLHFEEFFAWLGRSASIAADAVADVPAEGEEKKQVELDQDVSGWLGITL